MLQTNKKGHVAPLLKCTCYEIRAIYVYLEGAAFSVNTIC